MVQRQLEARGIHDARVLAAMRKIDREAFLPEAMREFAYEDSALPIEEGQTISQPYIVARMIEAAGLNPADRVLEIGAGSGYAAAVMAELAMRVYTIERHPALAQLAETRLHTIGYRNVDVRTGDGTLGWPEAAPFDVIIAAAGGPQVPRALKDQLAVGGRLVIPVGDTPNHQHLVRVTRTGSDSYDTETLDEVMFVPLIGEQGWDADAVRDRRSPGPERKRRPAAPRALPRLIREAARPLPEPEDDAFADAFERFGDRRIVLLGEASHGTSEFYRARGNHAPADRAPWLRHRRGRGRLAPTPWRSITTSGTGPGLTVRARCSAASRPGCGATPTPRPSSAGCASGTCA